MRTGELANQARVNPETLRYYERRGLLNTPPRTSGGYRDYPVDAVTLPRFIKRAQHRQYQPGSDPPVHPPQAAALPTACAASSAAIS
jgi:hypothetical protein